MSGLVPGKRYRFSYDVRVDSTGDTYIEDTGRRVDDSLMRGATVEQLPDPLPTTPGSVIRWDDPTDNPHRVVTRTLVRLPYPSPWQDVLHIAVTFTDFEVAGATVLFDAGADQ